MYSRRIKMSNSFSDAVNKILSENKSIDINQSGKTLVEKVNDVQIDQDGQDKFHQEKKLLGPNRFKKWFKRRTLKKSDMTDQEQEQHHQDNRKLAAAGVKDSVEYTGEPMNETHAPGSVEMVYRDHTVIDTGREDRHGFQMFDVHKGGKKTHSNVRLSTAKDVLDNARNRNTERANKKLENPKESVELDECWDTHVQQGYKMKGGKRVPNCVPKESTDATSAADDFLNELSQEFGAENITLDTIMENIDELETLLTSLKEYFGIDESAEGDTILTAHDMASTNDPYEHQAMAVQKIKDIINKGRNEETTKESNNGK